MDAGVKIFNLSVGEPKLFVHTLITEVALDALVQGKTFYPPVLGLPELQVLASEWMNSTLWLRFSLRKLFSA